MTDFPMQGRFTEIDPEKDPLTEGVVTNSVDPLSLEIPDDELVEIADRHSDDYITFYENKYDLFDRRKKLEIHFFGRQVLEMEKERLLKDYESKFMDNVLYEIAMTKKPLAMARLPDLLITPGNTSEEAKLTADSVSKAIDTQVKEAENRAVLGLAVQHRPVYFIACIKARWDPEKDDYIFETIHPDLIELDYTCPNKNADNMQYVAQIIPSTVEEMIMRFPGKKEEIFQQLQKDGVKVGDPKWSAMATTVKYKEIWFTWYKKHSDTQWERIEGVMWKYKEVILDKMKNPDFDYEGEEKYFSYQEDGNKEPAGQDELMEALITGQIPQNVKQETVYHNYFRFPRKPFYFMGYDQWGKQPMDETSWMEQNLQNQKSLDKRGKQIEETLDQRGHHVFSKESGLTPSDVEALDLNAPDEDLVVDGDVNKTHKYIPPARPEPQEFQEIQNIRNRMYESSGSNATRGEIKSQVATNTQIAREENYTRADDEVEDTVNDAAKWMAEWALQFIKLRYTKTHFRQLLGVAGDVVWLKLNRNMVDDGMIVKIKASGTDKIRAQNNAMDMAKMQMIDPFQFFVDMGLSDPEGRTEKLILSKADPVAYLQKVVQGIDTSQALAKALMNAQMPNQPTPPPPTAPGAPPMQQGQTPQPGMPPAQAQQPTPQNTAQVPTAPSQGVPQGSPRMI